jgi:predicted AAA+ superfamily ATPase
MLESVIRFMFGNVGNLCSVKKISDTMTSAGRKISTHTVESYLSALTDSFVLYRASRFDVKGKQHLKTLEKYYVVDTGLRSWLLGSKGQDVGYLLENVVYLELIRRGYAVYVGKVGAQEIDFIAMNDQGVEYFQAAASVRNGATLRRELAPLESVQDSYPKWLLTLDDDPPASINGIRRRYALDFLLD